MSGVPWWVWGLASAVSMGAVDVLSKRALREFEPGLVGLSRLGFGLLFLAIPWWLAPPTALAPEFWRTVALMIPFEIAAFFLLLEALRAAPLAETVPFLSLSPLFTVLASWLILGERVTAVGFLGILLIAAGGYLLYWHELRHGALGPLRAMVRSRGTRLMTVVALIYSVTSVFGKQMTMVSSPLLFPGLYFAVLFAAFAAVQGLRGMRPAAVWHAVCRRPGVLITMGILDGVSFLVHSIGVLMAPVAYFIGVKRLSSVVSVVAGGLLFREDHLRTRAAGAFCMVAGVVLLTLRA
ncbi:MAG: hypothetical protein A3C53_01470 [Omnitrophica WOR_2 bacterium RIFCSPHIGHO2_02_FULL_68_15]|nr:MAG: hypothetical protein A3C53_01470 [Omnitrophica WOR_2 bacterium RIFCSPHIGHO2_02_FULL_68_15]